MQFPLAFWDIDLWLAVTAIILLATAELISPRYKKTSLVIEKERLRKTALALGVLFMVTVTVRIYQIIVLP